MRQIANPIVSGNLEPGSKLPNERELAEQFDVTRSRVREALRALALIGMIQIRSGEGSFVTRQDDALPSDALEGLFHKERTSYEELYEARKLIEISIHCLAAQHISSDEH